uniref:Uncharacterized protein n=1 Tax=Lotharella oceanica TaxID=641309 RepID=A0A7S2U3S7_9EUKA|mmetsp:Transcript_6057/g.12129  ORF Transcript_6057/g.12129 Transcript_6057/m.12129 type:complete len:269 (+) Transcript_6057:1061-1867(+)
MVSLGCVCMILSTASFSLGSGFIVHIGLPYIAPENRPSSSSSSRSVSSGSHWDSDWDTVLRMAINLKAKDKERDEEKKSSSNGLTTTTLVFVVVVLVICCIIMSACYVCIKRRRKKRRDQDAPPRELKAPDGDKTSSRGGGEEKRVDPPFAAVYPQAVPGGVMHERKSSVLSVGKAHHAALPNVPGDLTHERKGSVHSVGSVPPYHAPRSSVELMFMNDSKGNSHQLPPSAPAQNPKVAKEKRSDLCASEASPPSAPPLNLDGGYDQY